MSTDELTQQQIATIADIIRAIRHVATDESLSTVGRHAAIGLFHVELGLIRDEIAGGPGRAWLEAQTDQQVPLINAAMASLYVERIAQTNYRSRARMALLYVRDRLERVISTLSDDGPKVN